jgi:hypothetical protein
MTKWSLFRKSKSEEETKELEKIEETPTKEIIEIRTEEEPLAEYNETLQTGKPSSKKPNSKSLLSEQRHWRDINSIENKVDNIHKTRAEKPMTEVDRTVDKLIEKRKKK